MKTKNQYRLLAGVPLNKLAEYIEKSEHDGFELFQVLLTMVPVNNMGGIVQPGQKGAQLIVLGNPLMVRTISADPPKKDGR
jgi:hypothetical protein